MSEIHGKYGPDGNNTADKTPDGKFNGKSDSNYNFESNIKNVNAITIFFLSFRLLAYRLQIIP